MGRGTLWVEPNYGPDFSKPSVYACFTDRKTSQPCGFADPVFQTRMKWAFAKPRKHWVFQGSKIRAGKPLQERVCEASVYACFTERVAQTA